MNKKYLYLIIGLLMCTSVFLAYQVSQASPAIPNPGHGISDLEIGDPYGYHRNNCGAGEYFVQIPAGSGLGLCFEVNERAAQVWGQAFKTCRNLGKRLPDYMEWRFACDGNYSGGGGTVNSNLNSMTGNWEWAESRPSAVDYGAGSGAGSVVAGSTDCGSVYLYWVRMYDGSEYSSAFRCVR